MLLLPQPASYPTAPLAWSPTFERAERTTSARFYVITFKAPKEKLRLK